MTGAEVETRLRITHFSSAIVVANLFCGSFKIMLNQSSLPKIFLGSATLLSCQSHVKDKEPNTQCHAVDATRAFTCQRYVRIKCMNLPSSKLSSSNR